MCPSPTQCFSAKGEHKMTLVRSDVGSFWNRSPDNKHIIWCISLMSHVSCADCIFIFISNEWGYIGPEVHMIYCIWCPLIIPISKIPPHTTLYSRSALYTNYFRVVFFLLLEELKYQPQHEMTVFFFFLCREWDISGVRSHYQRCSPC